MSKPTPDFTTGDQPVWAVMRSGLEGTPYGVLAPTRIDMRPLLTHMPRRNLKRTLIKCDFHYGVKSSATARTGGTFDPETWLAGLVEGAGVSARTVQTVTLSRDDLAATWEWVAANRWSDLLVYTYRPAPGVPDSVLDLRLGRFRPEVSETVLAHWERAARWMRDLAMALHATSSAGEDTLTGLPLSEASVHVLVHEVISELAGHLVGPTPDGPFMDLACAQVYARAGFTGPEARAYEFGLTKDRPSREVLATLAALADLDRSQ